MARLSVSRKVRRQILDGLSTEQVNWSGALDDVHFLQRIWDLDELPSTDHRFPDMRGDIYQHRMNNNDWEDDWIYSDARLDLLGRRGETFLEFLSELVHPLVRKDPDEAETLVRFFNDCLRPEGVVLATAAMQPTLGRPSRRIYAAARLHSAPKPLRVEKFESLLDSTVPKDKRGSEAAQRVLRSMVSTVNNLAELRNQLGSGCGRAVKSTALARHARLAANSTRAICEFLLETWLVREARSNAGEPN